MQRKKITLEKLKRRKSFDRQTKTTPSLDCQDTAQSAEEAVRNDLDFRDFKERMRASRRVTAMSIHQALHNSISPEAIQASIQADAMLSDEEPVPKKPDPIPTTSKRSSSMKKRESSIPEHLKNVLSRMTSRDLDEEVPVEETSYLRTRYMQRLSSNLKNESWA